MENRFFCKKKKKMGAGFKCNPLLLEEFIGKMNRLMKIVNQFMKMVVML